MEPQSEKRIRGDENSEKGGLTLGTCVSNCPNSNEDQDFIETFPELVSVIFLEWSREVEVLKTCRLVCKLWNIYATESLRGCSEVLLSEENPILSDFKKLLLQRGIGQFEALPSAFRNFHVEGNSFADPTFLTLINNPNISITTLSLSFNWDERDPDESQLRQLLTAHQTNIESLIITPADGDFILEDGFIISDEVKLSSLKSLYFQDLCHECTHIEFMKSFLRMCKPQQIHMFFMDSTSMHSLLLEAEIENLKIFLLDSVISMSSWNYLASVRFSRLRKLTFIVRKLNRFNSTVDQLVGDVLPQWGSICQNVSPWLEEFVTNVPINTASDLKFPQLKTVEVAYNTDFSALTPDKFPSLEKVILYNEGTNDYAVVEDTPVPHLGVESLEMTIQVSSVDDPPLHSDLMVLLKYVSQQFPKVTSFTFTISKFDPTTITVGNIFEAFPNLRKLSLQGRCDFKNISGMDNATIAEYVEQGLPIENIPRAKSITDFMELETIVFGSCFDVDPDMVRYCLPRVPKLREVTLHWNDSLSEPLLRDSIGHLKRNTIKTVAIEFESGPFY